MKKFLIFLISTLILLVGCQSNKVNNDVYFDKIASISRSLVGSVRCV